MTLDLDTFLAALYTIVDDLYQENFAAQKPLRPGRVPRLSDSEVLTLALCAQWFDRSERAFVRYAIEHWQSYFPGLTSQSAYNRRIRYLTGVLVKLVNVISSRFQSAYQAIDTVPVPLMRRCRGHRHRLFADEAAIGRGGVDKDWYYGCKLLLAVSDGGMVTGFMLAPASTEDRWVAEALLCWRSDPQEFPLEPEHMPRRGNGQKYVGPTGPVWPRTAAGSRSIVPYLADNGFFGALWQNHWRSDYGAVVLTPRNYRGDDAIASRRQHSGWRQVVETANEHLEHVFGLHFCRARTKWGLLTRVAAKIAALNLGIWINRLFDRPDLAFATLFNC